MAPRLAMAARGGGMEPVVSPDGRRVYYAKQPPEQGTWGCLLFREKCGQGLWPDTGAGVPNSPVLASRESCRVIRRVLAGEHRCEMLANPNPESHACLTYVPDALGAFDVDGNPLDHRVAPSVPDAPIDPPVDVHVHFSGPSVASIAPGHRGLFDDPVARQTGVYLWTVGATAS